MFQRRDAAWQIASRAAAPAGPAVRVQHSAAFAWGSFAPAPGGAVIHVDKRDALDVALDPTCWGGHEDPSPLVLILADADTPGGCVQAGAGMQEESLFRRTALAAALPHHLYPIPIDGALYAGAVPVLMRSEADGFAPLPLPPPTRSFLACPGIKMPRLTQDGNLFPEDHQSLRVKVELILQAALSYGHRDLVLGALGCGVWGCPAREVAGVFHQVLAERGKWFRDVRFAILGANCGIFADVLRTGDRGVRPPATQNPMPPPPSPPPPGP